MLTGAAEEDSVFITKVWGKIFTVNRGDYEHDETFTYTHTMMKILLREACAANGGLTEEDVDDTRSELAKAVDKGICCTGVQFKKHRKDAREFFEGTLETGSSGNLAKFKTHASIRFSRIADGEDAQWSKSVKISHVSDYKLTIDGHASVPDDIESGHWRIDLMPNQRALHNGLTCIVEATKKENTPMHKLTIQNPFAIPMSPEEKMHLKHCDVLDEKKRQWLDWYTKDHGMNTQQVKT